jgi:hypothetical protein
MDFWNFEHENLEEKLSEVSFYNIGPDVLKLNYSKLSDLTFYLQSISHLMIGKIAARFDFQIF